MGIEELLIELEIEAKRLEAQNKIPLAAKTELLIIKIRELLKEKNHVS